VITMKMMSMSLCPLAAQVECAILMLFILVIIHPHGTRVEISAYLQGILSQYR